MKTTGFRCTEQVFQTQSWYRRGRRCGQMGDHPRTGWHWSTRRCLQKSRASIQKDFLAIRHVTSTHVTCRLLSWNGCFQTHVVPVRTDCVQWDHTLGPGGLGVKNTNGNEFLHCRACEGLAWVPELGEPEEEWLLGEWVSFSSRWVMNYSSSNTRSRHSVPGMQLSSRRGVFSMSRGVEVHAPI